MALDRLTKVDGGGISTTSDYRVGVITASKFVGPIDGVVTGTLTGTATTAVNAQGLIGTPDIVVGIITASSANFSGNVSIGGTLTYEDVTNIDSVGIITARDGIDCNADLDVDGHTNLDNVSVAGVTTFTDDVYFDGATAGRDIVFDRSDNQLEFAPNAKIRMGGSFPLTIYNNTNSYITQQYQAALFIESKDVQIYGSGGGYNAPIFIARNGIVELGYEPSGGNLSTQLKTSAKGITVGTGVTIETNGQATFVGVVTFGSGSTTIDNNVVNVGTALTLGHTQGVQFHTQNLHSRGFEVNQINASGIITASQFKGDGSQLTGIDATALKDPAGNVKVQAQASGAVHSGISTFQDIDVDGHTELDNVNIAGIVTVSSDGINAGILDLKTGGNLRLRFSSGGTAQFRGDTDPIASFDRGSANSTNVKWGYLGADRGIISSISNEFRITASGTIPMTFHSNGSERININSTGRVTFSGQIFQANTSTTLLPTGNNYGTYAYTQYPHELVIDNNATGTQGSFAGIYFNAGADSDGSKVGTARISAVETGNYKADLVFSTRNTSFTEKLRIKANGYVGINTDNPARYLHIVGNDGPTGATLGNSDTQLVLDNKGVNGAIIEFLSDTNGGGRLQFTDTDGINRGRLEYVHSSDTMRFHTMGGERLVISSSGQLTVYGSTNNTTLVLEADSNRSASLRIKNNGTEYASFQAGPTTTDQSLQIIRQGNNPIRFVNGSGADENLRIESNGRVNFHTGNNDMTNPDIGGGTSGVSINKNTLGQIYACTDNADNTAANDYQTVCINVARRNTSGDGPHIALDRGGWIKASIAGLQGSNTATSGPGIFAVYTHDYSSGQNVRTERIRVSGSNGNVGISDDQPSSIPRKLWVYEASNDPYIRIQRGSTSNVTMGGFEIASSNGNGNNVLATMLARGAGNSATTGSMIFQVRDQGNNYEVVRLMGQSQGAVQGNRMLVNGNQVCVFGSPLGTSGTQARDGNITTYNTVYEHSSSSYRTSDNGAFGGVFAVGGNANYWYPVWFQQPTNCPPQDLWINKYVHNYATWDGSLNFRATLCGTGYGAYTVQHRVHFYSSSSKEFIGKIIYTGHNNAYLVCWMRGGGRSYGWGTTGGNGITVNVGDDGNSHNLGPGNGAETYITNNLTIPQGYEQAMTTSGQHQQSDGF